jgi:hypothetical protein
VKLIKKITKHTFKFFILPFGILATILILTAIAVFYFFPKDKLLSMITAEGETLFKRKVVISDISYNLRGVTITNCRILKSLEPADDTLFSAGSISLRISPKELIHNKIKIKSIVIKDLDTVLTYADGRWNIQDFIDDIRSSDSKEKSGTKTEIDYIQFENARLLVKEAPERIRPLAGEYFFGGTVRVPENAVTVSDFSLRLPESRGLIEGPELKAAPLDKNFSVHGTLQLTDVALGWVYKWKDIDFLPYTHVTGVINEFNVTSKEVAGIYEGKGAIKGRSAVQVSGTFKAYPDTVSLTLSDVTVKIGKSTAKLKSLIVPPKGDPSFSVSSLDGYLEDISPLIPYAPPGLGGRVNGSLAVQGKSVTCEVSLKSGRFGFDRTIVSDITTNLSMKGNILKIENLPCSLFGQSAKISLAAPESIFKELIINVSLNDFNIDKITGSKKEDGQTGGASASAGKTNNTASSPSTELPLRIRGNFDAQSVVYDGYKFSKCFVVYDAAKSAISVPRFSGQFLDSNVTGSVMIDLAKKNPSCDVKFNVADLKVQRLEEIKKELSHRIFGTAAARGSLKFNPFAESASDTMQGKIDFQITGGKISNTGIQDELGVFLDPLKYKLKDLEFNRINGTLTINGSNITFNPLAFNSSYIRLMAEGSIIQRDQLDSRMVLEFDNTFIQDLPNPALLALQKYKHGKWYTVNFTAKGKISEGKYDVKSRD